MSRIPAQFIEAMPEADRERWLLLSRAHISKEERTILVTNTNDDQPTYYVLSGIKSHTAIEQRMFYIMSLFHRILSRQKVIMSHVSHDKTRDYWWALTAGKVTWTATMKEAFGIDDLKPYARLTVRAYAYCMATGDPYNQKWLLNQFIQEALGLDTFDAKIWLATKVQDNILDAEAKTIIQQELQDALQKGAVA